MKVRLHSPAPKIEYFLDCAVQAGELDACTGFTLRLYDRDTDVLPIIDADPGCKWRVRAQKHLRLCELADDILPSLPPYRQSGLVRAGLTHVVDEMLSFAETFSNWAIDDEVEGGDLEPWRDRMRSKNGIPFKRTLRRLCAPRFIRRYVKNHVEEADHFRALCDVAVRRARTFSPTHDPTIMQDWRMQMGRTKAIEDRRRRVDVRAERKVIVRSYNVAVSMLGTETVRAFLAGDEISLIGREVALVVRKKGALADKGHGCLSVGLVARDGTRLADLCTFIESTPTLDQLCGFALWMAAGEERKVIETANIIDVMPEAKTHPLIVDKTKHTIEDAMRELRAMDPSTADAIAKIIAGRSRARRQLNYEQTRARNDAYWEKTKGMWIEAMLANVVGYRNLPVLKAAGVL